MPHKRTSGDMGVYPNGFTIVQIEKRYYPMKIEITGELPGLRAMLDDDNTPVSYSKRTYAMYYLYRYATKHNIPYKFDTNKTGK